MKKCFQVVRTGQETVDCLIGKEGNNTLKTATGTQPRLKAGFLTVMIKILNLKFIQAGPEMEVGPYFVPQLLYGRRSKLFEHLPDAPKTDELIPVILAHAKVIHEVCIAFKNHWRRLAPVKSL